MVPLLCICFAISNVFFLAEAFIANGSGSRRTFSISFTERRIRDDYYRTNTNTNNNNGIISSTAKQLSLRSTENDNDNIPPSASLSSSPTRRIQRTLHEIGQEITKNKNVKEINLQLVTLGQHFNSYKKRFDFLELLSKESRDTYYSNQGSSPSSLWIRNNSENVNVQEFIQAFKKVDSIEAKEEANILHVQSYHRILQSGKDEKLGIQSKQILEANTKIEFQIKTIKGKPTSSLSENNVLIGELSLWEGDKYITEYHYQNDILVRVERYLVSGNDDEIQAAPNSLTNIKMMVNTTFYGESKLVQCQETFYPIIKMEDILNNSLDQDKLDVEKITSMKPLRSNLERVPGCIANVNIYTTLIPKHAAKKSGRNTYDVLVDGETDTLLSRGLLSVLSGALSRLNSEEVLNIEPYRIANDLNLRSVLSTGRNDGLSNMVSIVQNQIRNLENKYAMTKDIISSKDDETEVRHESISSSKKPTVAVLLSGGVDSAVALNLLCQQDYDVTAFYLKIWLEDELAHLGQCPWEDDYNTCIEVCKHAGNISLEAISLQDAYKERVISYTIEEAKKGRTPNPDIMCNSRIKFGCFYDAIADRGFDYVASGHYAQLKRVENDDKNANDGSSVMKLLRAPDPVKDQSYFLAALRQDQLKRVLFPIGHLQKSEVRALAEEFDLPNKSRPDSQGLCFLGKVKFDEFLAAYLGKNEGDIIDAHTGEIIGRHNGIWYHTVGQRKGIGKVLNPKATSRGPWYVVAKDPDNRKIIASNKYDEEIFHETRSEFYVEDIRWIAGVAPNQLKTIGDELKLKMKIRHGPTIVVGTLTMDTLSSGTIHLEEKDGGLAPGQFVAFYDEMECLGSSVISEKHWLKFKTELGGNEVAYQK